MRQGYSAPPSRATCATWTRVLCFGGPHRHPLRGPSLVSSHQQVGSSISWASAASATGGPSATPQEKGGVQEILGLGPGSRGREAPREGRVAQHPRLPAPVTPGREGASRAQTCPHPASAGKDTPSLRQMGKLGPGPTDTERHVRGCPRPPRSGQSRLPTPTRPTSFQKEHGRLGAASVQL